MCAKGSPGEPQEIGKAPVKRVLAYGRPHLLLMVLTAVLALAEAAAYSGAAFLIKPIIQKGFEEKAFWAALGVLAVFVILSALRGVLAAAGSYAHSVVAQRVVRTVREQTFRHLLRLPYAYHLNHPRGEVLQRLIGESHSINGCLSVLSARTLQQCFTAAAMLAWLLILSWRLTLVAFAGGAFVLLATLVVSRRARRAVFETYRSEAEIGGTAQERLLGIKLIQSYGIADREAERFRRQSDKLLRYNLRLVLISSVLSPVSDVIGAAGICGIALVGIRLVAEGRLTAAAFGAFVGAFLILYRSVKGLCAIYHQFQLARVGASRVFEILDTPVDVHDTPGAIDLGEAAPTIRFENVTFAYDGQPPVLKQLNVELLAGRIVAVVGHSGAGKTTMVNLLLRFFDPQGGSVQLNGRDIRGYTLSSLRRRVGIVTQEIILFSDTIRNNIGLSAPQATEEQIVEAAKAANAHEFIIRLPQGYDTQVGEGGGKLSRGEGQRISLARTLLRKPSLLILDEAMSNIDAESENAIQQALQQWRGTHTVVIISHRLSAARHSDLVVVLMNGRVVEQGSHESLLREAGDYRRYYRLQFGDDAADEGAAGSRDAGASGTSARVGAPDVSGAKPGIGSPRNLPSCAVRTSRAT